MVIDAVCGRVMVRRAISIMGFGRARASVGIGSGAESFLQSRERFLCE